MATYSSNPVIGTGLSKSGGGTTLIGTLGAGDHVIVGAAEVYNYGSAAKLFLNGIEIASGSTSAKITGPIHMGEGDSLTASGSGGSPLWHLAAVYYRNATP